MAGEQSQALASKNFNIFLDSNAPFSLDPDHTDERQAEFEYYVRNQGKWVQGKLPAQVSSTQDVLTLALSDVTDDLTAQANISLELDNSPFTDAVTAELANGSKFQFKGQKHIEGLPPGVKAKTWVASMQGSDFDASKIGSGIRVKFSAHVQPAGSSQPSQHYWLDPKMDVRT